MLTGDDLYDWMALRRVHDGGVVAVDGDYVHHGRPLADHVAAALTQLLKGGFLALGRPDPVGHRTVCVTVAGQVRYAELQRGRG